MTYIVDGFPALGTAWWIEISSILTPTEAAELQSILLTAISEFETRYSRFKTDSLISEINTKRELHSPDLQLQTILQYGADLYNRTNTYFNFLIGDILNARGYTADYRFTPTTEPTQAPNPDTALTISEKSIALHEGMIDIGGFGKGYLIDELARILKECGVSEFLINGGGDMYGTTLDGAPIQIYLEHPTEPKTFLGTITIQNQGFAASSPFKRHWLHDGHSYNHIVGDTKQPLASFVVAKTARDADAFATMVLLASEDELSAAKVTEGFGYARFNPATSEFTCSNFPFSTL